VAWVGGLSRHSSPEAGCVCLVWGLAWWSVQVDGFDDIGDGQAGRAGAVGGFSGGGLGGAVLVPGHPG
jgi:hypothetical protein